MFVDFSPGGLHLMVASQWLHLRSQAMVENQGCKPMAHKASGIGDSILLLKLLALARYFQNSGRWAAFILLQRRAETLTTLPPFNISENRFDFN